MAHFAKLDENDVVTQVIVVHNNDAPDEASGLSFLETLYGPGIVWVQTSYNTHANEHSDGGTPLRKNYAGIGYTYNRDLDAFIPPQPFPSWLLDEDVGCWNSPVPYPEDGEKYKWDEPTTSWVILE